MWKQKLNSLNSIKALRVLQLLLVAAAVWFFFWGSINEMLVWKKTFVQALQDSFLNIVASSILIAGLVLVELKARRNTGHSTSVKQPDRTLEEMQREIELLRHEAQKSRRVPSNKIGISLLIIGALVLAASIVSSSTILAFIGLGLTFWGALFLFARPVKFVRSFLLDFTVVSSYATIDRILEDLNYEGKPIYIPPYPEEAYLPEHLKGLKEMVAFIPEAGFKSIPSIEEMAEKQFLLKNSKGICIIPPGLGLADLFEQELKTEFPNMDIESLYNSLPSVIVNNLELARSLEMNSEDTNLTHLRIVGSVYSDLYREEHRLKNIHSIGCPLISAIACALSKTSGKPVTIVKDVVSPDSKVIEVWYQILEV